MSLLYCIPHHSLCMCVNNNLFNIWSSIDSVPPPPQINDGALRSMGHSLAVSTTGGPFSAHFGCPQQLTTYGTLLPVLVPSNAMPYVYAHYGCPDSVTTSPMLMFLTTAEHMMGDLMALLQFLNLLIHDQIKLVACTCYVTIFLDYYLCFYHPSILSYFLVCLPPHCLSCILAFKLRCSFMCAHNYMAGLHRTLSSLHYISSRYCHTVSNLDNSAEFLASIHLQVFLFCDCPAQILPGLFCLNMFLRF
jgi:hypothetical protein